MAAPIQFPNRARTPATKTAAASLVPVRQRTQFTCVAASTSMALAALGLQDCDEDTVNRVLGAAPMKGAAWEQVLATAQHYGVRATLTVPSTLSQVKAWTDAGKPVLIGWNPEGRDWSHASVIFDVQPCPVHGFMVYVADPNCPDPEQVVRVVPKSEFYAKWYEKFPNYLVRRPALMLEREITPEGRQVMASQKNRGTVLVDVPHTVPVSAAARKVQAKAPTPVMPKNKGVVSGPGASQRNVIQQGLIERGTSGAGKHKNKQDFDRGHARSPKHKGQKGWGAEYMTLPVEEACGAEYMGGEACGAEYMQDHAAKFEQGVPADPTKNMSKADAAEWEKQNAMHRDQFKTARVSLLPSEAARLRAAGLEDACWEGYEAVGMKEQGGKQVPNCVPTKTAAHRLDGVRGHQLLPATVARKLPAIYSQENVADPVAQVKLFSPYTGAVWYLTEYDPSSKQAFGWADLGMGGGELGYIHIPELEGLNRRGLPLVERDLYWKPMPLSRAKHSRTASQHHAKFPRGEKMTVDEVAAVVGPEFKEMNENPPESVLAIRREMEKQAGTWTPERRLLTALGAVAEAVQHAGLIAREAPHAAQAADKALKLLEAAEQVLGRDVARNLSLPSYR